MDVVELLYVLPLCCDVEIMTPRLPECARQIISKQCQLVFRLALFVASPERDPLFQNLHNNRWVLDLRFTNQQMNVFGHDNVTCHHELIFLSGFFQDFQEKVTSRRGVQKGQSPIAGAGNEMPVALAVDAYQSFRHRLILYPTLCA